MAAEFVAWPRSGGESAGIMKKERVLPADNHPRSQAEISGFELSDLMFTSLQIQEIKKKFIRNALDFNSLISPVVPLIHTAKEMRPQTNYEVPVITVCVTFQCKRLQAASF